MTITANIWKRLDQLPQFQGDTELEIAKNDPKNGQDDYWWVSYGRIHLTGYYSLKQLLIDFDKECAKNGYYE